VRCRHFTLRRSPRHAQADADQLNAFLRQVSVYTVQSTSSANGCWSVLVFYEEPGEVGRASGAGAEPQTRPADATALSAEERRIYAQLQAWRGRRAQAAGRPAALIADDATLATIARRQMSLAVASALAAGGHSELEGC
jgi:hypothetical protein